LKCQRAHTTGGKLLRPSPPPPSEEIKGGIYKAFVPEKADNKSTLDVIELFLLRSLSSNNEINYILMILKPSRSHVSKYLKSTNHQLIFFCAGRRGEQKRERADNSVAMLIKSFIDSLINFFVCVCVILSPLAFHQHHRQC
jgi:predicted transcriptional regulator